MKVFTVRTVARVVDKVILSVYNKPRVTIGAETQDSNKSQDGEPTDGKTCFYLVRKSVTTDRVTTYGRRRRDRLLYQGIQCTVKKFEYEDSTGGGSRLLCVLIEFTVQQLVEHLY